MSAAERNVGLGVCVAAGLLFSGTTLWVSVQPRDEPAASPAGVGRKAEAPLEIRIVHDDPCTDPLRAGKPCRKDEDWQVRIDGRGLNDPDELRALLRREADRATSGLRNPRTSERNAVIRGDESAPWGLVQRVMHECSQVGIYRIDWSILVDGKSGARWNAWLPTRPLSPDQEKVFLCEIRVFMRWDPGSASSLRKVGNRGQVDSDEDMMNIILQMVRDYAKAGKTNPPILIDATPDVPWRDVLHVLELCRKEALEPVEFAAPFLARKKP